MPSVPPQASLVHEAPEIAASAAEALDSACASLSAQINKWSSLLSMEHEWGRMVATCVQGALPLPSALEVCPHSNRGCCALLCCMGVL